MQQYSKVQDAALLVMRLVLAAIFLYAGSAKWPFWSTPLEGMSVFMHNVVRFLSLVEPLGSVALVLGVLTRWAAAGLAIIMVGAIVYTRITLNTALFTSPQGTGLDYNLLILAGCIALVAFGAGGWSVEALRKKAQAEPAAQLNDDLNETGIMNLFGDPRAPRRNLWGGLILAAFGAYWMGLATGALEAAEPWPGAHGYAWRQLVLGALLIFGALMQFRLGLRAARFPPHESAADRPVADPDTPRAPAA